MTQSIPRWSLPSQRILFGLKRDVGADRSASAVPSTAVSLLRTGLVLGCAIAIGMAAWLGHPAAYLNADPALARLLRGMALIKGMIALAIVCAVCWRLAWPIDKRAGAAYLIGSWAVAGSTMLIWQLSYIVPAAVLFHAAALSLFWVSWRECGQVADLRFHKPR
jgi:hypothetical protein